jgi:hypothetical protein
MHPIMERLILLGMDLAVVGLNKMDVKALTTDLAAKGKTDEEISAILDDLSMAESKDIRAKIAAARA